MSLRTPFPDDIAQRVAAAVTTLALLLLAWRMLAHVPERHAPEGGDAARIQLRFVEPMPRSAVRAERQDDAPPPQMGEPPARPGRAPVPADARVDAGGSGVVEATDARMTLYADDGRALLPADDDFTAASASGREDAARRLLERENPVDYRGTRFAKDWISDGDVGDVAEQGLARAQKKAAQILFGPDIQHAQARPSPEVRFNPARHERPSDLGSEATGDAYKAAPINYEQAPGLEGEASRRIRDQVAVLEKRIAGCEQARVRELMAPLLRHLDELQKAEAAFARGADPVRAQHMLPNQANAAYDGARRALWHAQRQLAGCLR